MRIAIVLLLMLISSGGLGEAAAQGEGDRLTVYLLTMGTGDAVWEKYGHNAIWIHDSVRASDRVYNYGVFDFNSPGYWSRFIKGDWLYQLAVSDIDETLYQYQYLNRTIVAQELALTPSQEIELARFLEWNYRPENREYLYDYFRDNCSTRIRDAIDLVLGGRLRWATENQETGTTFRWHSRRLMAGLPVVYTALNAGLGPAADHPVTAWEEMFLPEKVQLRVRDLRVPAENGGLQPLVRSERVLYEAVGRAPDRVAPPSWMLTFLAIGVLAGSVLAVLATFASRSGVARFGFTVLATVWALLMGIGGILLVGLWAFTNHTAAHRNENLFQFDPLALLLVVLVPAAVYGVRWARRPAQILALTVAAISVLGFVIQPVPGLDQVNGEIIAFILPVNLALALGVWLVGRRGERVNGRQPAGLNRQTTFHGRAGLRHREV